ncbi:hypothetical protein RvY_18878 [Ramazzottius varieornatus]|uniref:Putative rRNA methyltransferase n=1 Tax=Ramazzottius varieornatus TaxID=947166 RepID=A0A1D1WB91_RAMVA|nr:hypothetical protein RvY_18878 [Ramazzottius varieornatus]
MGKKVKVGKARKDKFYHLAKESGYRSRAAFKLIQLNRTYEFLQRSRVLIDLCAAPGGWLQVAKQFMPVSSIILGVDLVPIKAIPNVITLQEDITTEHCKAKIRHELKTWKADVVLHDGAPNVGKNWLHDAFTQARLTLSAFKLATAFLTKNGWFITKIFRSKDYHALLWVFQQFFKKVVATKPPASRHESAEIFVVCSGYIAPDKIDGRLLDAKHVFEDVDESMAEEDATNADGTSKKRTAGAAKLNLLLHPEKKKKSAEGYAEGKVLLGDKLAARAYIEAEEDKSKELLSQCHQIVIDEEDKGIATHPATTDELRLCCQDIKVLGKRELRLLINWRKDIRKSQEEAAKKEKAKEDEGLVSVKAVTTEEEMEAAIARQIAKVEEDERLEARRKRKKLNKLRRQLQEKMNLKMILPGDTLLAEEEQKEERLFSLDNIKSSKKLEQVMAGERDAGKSFDEEEEEEMEGDDNPLLVGREGLLSRKARMTREWFDKDIFAGLDLKKSKPKKTEVKEEEDEWENVGGREDDDSEDEDEVMEFEVVSEMAKETAAQNGQRIKTEESLQDNAKVMLDAEGFALAEELIKSKKRRREMIEAGFHREAFNETDDMLPSWFVDDEKKHCRRSLVDSGLITKEQVRAHKEQLRAIDARPIKKIAEATARKKIRALKRLEKARKKASNLLSNDAPDQLSAQEKMSQLKSIYKKAAAPGKAKSKAPVLVVSKKGGGTAKTERPAKGTRIKVVDRRMKKDMKRTNSAGKGGKKTKGKKKAAKKASRQQSTGRKKQ